MATIAELHTAIKARLETISGLRAFDHPPQGASPPAAFCALQSWEPQAMVRKGFKQYTFDVYILTSESVRPQDGYQSLMVYADEGSSSIELAIWDGNDRPAGTFGGLAETSAHVVGFRALGAAEMDEIQAYGGVFTVQVLTREA